MVGTHWKDNRELQEARSPDMGQSSWTGSGQGGADQAKEKKKSRSSRCKGPGAGRRRGCWDNLSVAEAQVPTEVFLLTWAGKQGGTEHEAQGTEWAWVMLVRAKGNP